MRGTSYMNNEFTYMIPLQLSGAMCRSSLQLCMFTLCSEFSSRFAPSAIKYASWNFFSTIINSDGTLTQWSQQLELYGKVFLVPRPQNYLCLLRIQIFVIVWLSVIVSGHTHNHILLRLTIHYCTNIINIFILTISKFQPSLYPSFWRNIYSHR